MVQYTVLSDGILNGTIADLPAFVTKAWLAILFEAEKLKGRVYLPVRVLAKKASISTEDAIESLRLLQSPDPLSSSSAHGGRRLLPVENEENWYIVTTWAQHAREREVFFHRLRQQRHTAKQRLPSTPERKDL